MARGGGGGGGGEGGERREDTHTSLEGFIFFSREEVEVD